jgi:hypothetical protein
VSWSDLKQLLFPDDEFAVRYKGTVPVVRVTGELRQQRYEPPRGALVDFDGARLVEVDFTNTRFHTFSASAGSVFERCNFRAMVAEGGGMGDHTQQVVYKDCHFEGADLSDVIPGTARFERCTFQDLSGWICGETEFVECRFLGRVQSLNFIGRPWDPGRRRFKRLKPPRTLNEFVSNDFSRAELIDVSFMYGIDLSIQKLPESTAYIRLDRRPERMRVARSVVQREWRGGEQEQAMLMLDVLDRHSSDPWQQDLFARRDEEYATALVRDRVWGLLEHALD